jgi:transcriptional regulator with GAF, ATPase, and Fis domain
MASKKKIRLPASVSQFLSKQKYYYISLYILIPFTFSALSLLWVLLTYGFKDRFQPMWSGSLWSFPVWSLLVTVLTFLCGLLIIRLVLRPVSQFVRKAENLPLYPQSPSEKEETRAKDDLEHFSMVFKQVTELLSKVEARELFPGIIGQSRAMRAVFNHILKVAPTDTTVLISGESGTGKELVAQSIYEHSNRKGKPFIKLNCVAIPATLLESELFGYEKGAFTGATTQKKGKFEAANGGTIFLDEIGDMPAETQAKLLRVLQEKEFERVGGTTTINVDVRFIAATNKNLRERAAKGEFREDLFHRLNVFSIFLPPLRERREDIPLLVDHICGKMMKPMQVSPQALQLLLVYAWPGNIRELHNTIERASVLAEKGVIEPFHISPQITTDAMPQAVMNHNGTQAKTLDDRLVNIERGIIIEALQRAGGNQVKAAKLLGINRRSLVYRIAKLEIDIATLKTGTK